MKESVDDRLPQEAAHQRTGEVLAVEPRGFDGRNVGQLDAVDPARRQHAPRGPLPVDLGHQEVGLRRHVACEFGRRGGFHAQVQLARRPFAEIGDDRPRAQPREFAAHALDAHREPFVGLDGPLEILLDMRSQHFQRHCPPVGRDRAVHLRDRGGADGRLLDRREHRVPRLAERFLDGAADLREREGRQPVLQLRQFARRRFADEVGPGRERLPQLDRRRAHFGQRLAVARLHRRARSQPRQPRDPLHLRRAQRADFERPQHAVARQRPAPAQDPPPMRPVAGQSFQPWWIATAPPRIGV